METYADTLKRKGDDGESKKSKKHRKSGDDTLQYLREKMEVDKALRTREIELAERREQSIEAMLQQQQQQNQFMLALLMGQSNSNQNNLNTE